MSIRQTPPGRCLTIDEALTVGLTLRPSRMRKKTQIADPLKVGVVVKKVPLFELLESLRDPSVLTFNFVQAKSYMDLLGAGTAKTMLSRSLQTNGIRVVTAAAIFAAVLCSPIRPTRSLGGAAEADCFRRDFGHAKVNLHRTVLHQVSSRLLQLKALPADRRKRASRGCPNAAHHAGPTFHSLAEAVA